MGYVSLDRDIRVACQRPLRAVCWDCNTTVQWVCNNSAASKCGPCSERVRRRFARVIETGLQDASGFAYFLTLTAPSNTPHRQWVQGKVRGRPECSCWDHGLTLGQWNRQESACWNRLRTALAREVGDLAYAGTVEVQTKNHRGALHRHVVLRSSLPLDFAQVQRLAMAAGYGCVGDLQEIRSAAKMGQYLSKYVTKGGDREMVPWEAVKVVIRHRVIPRTGELVPVSETVVSDVPTYRLRSQSKSWGVTMAGIRAIAGAQARARADHLRQLSAQLDAPDVSAVAGLALDASPSSDPP